MDWLVVRHRVKDFPAWKRAFDGHLDVRNKMGCRGGYILSEETDPNLLTVALQCDDLAAAREFIASPEMKKVMEDAGVVGEPEIMFLKERHTVEDVRSKAA